MKEREGKDEREERTREERGEETVGEGRKRMKERGRKG